MNYSIFKDQSLAKNFDRDGFVKVPFLDDEGVTLFRSFIEKYLPAFQDCKYNTCSTTDLSRPEIVGDVDVFVSSHIRPYVDSYLTNYQPILGNYLVKKPGADSIIPIHQDWTFVDESKFYSLSIWCALQDTDVINGNLQVVPGSHKLFNAIRSSPTYESPLNSCKDKRKFKLMDIPLKCGEAIFFNHALFHASPPNNSNSLRYILLFGATHQSTQLLHYRVKDSFLRKYHINKDFFKKINRTDFPDDLEFVSSIPYLNEKSAPNASLLSSKIFEKVYNYIKTALR